ncbi:MAG: ABC transporter ATP-binding protein [Deltaproteobacteria bacterium]|nr:ABC transporter ATP-binding protein [Deltaproteobacteria bacterium]
MKVLEVRDLHSFYGKSHVIQGVSLELEPGAFVCLLGRNGVGKTTTLHSIMGMVKPKSGSILFKGEEIRGMEPFQIARKGIGIVPETRRIFASLTLEENLTLAMLGNKRRRAAKENRWTTEGIYRLFPNLAERKHQNGGHLSGGEQQMLTIARTLMGNPEILLVDEPTEGLAPLIAKRVMDMLRDISDAGITILVVEQNVKMAMKLVNLFYVMGKGRMVFEGNREALLEADEVRQQYLEV